MLRRIRAEYLEMPGMRLTLRQAQRLCGVERQVCERVLQELVRAGFLYVSADGSYARVTDEAFHRRPVKAALPSAKPAKAS
jgi:hypothetical protein